MVNLPIMDRNAKPEEQLRRIYDALTLLATAVNALEAAQVNLDNENESRKLEINGISRNMR